MSAILSPGFWVFVIVIAGIYTIFSLGLNLQLGYAGIANFGHVGFMALGSYVMAISIIQVSIPWWIASILAVLASMVVAVGLGMAGLRLRLEYMAIVTIAFAEIVRYMSMNLSVTGGVQGSTAIGGGNSGSFVSGWQGFQKAVQRGLAALIGDAATRDMAMLVIVWVIVIVLLLSLHVMTRSPWGRIVKALREDEDATAAMGKNVLRYKLSVMAIGSGMGALAGVLFAFQYSFFSPIDFETLVSFYGFIIIIVGGIGRNWAVPIGALIFSVIFAGTRLLSFWPLSEFTSAERAYLRFIIIGVLLIAMIMFRPQGIFGKREEMLLE